MIIRNLEESRACWELKANMRRIREERKAVSDVEWYRQRVRILEGEIKQMEGRAARWEQLFLKLQQEWRDKNGGS